MDDLFEAEKGHLLELPGVPFSNLYTRGGKVDSYATVIVDKNRYSVPTRYVGLKVTVNLYVEHLEIFYAGKKIRDAPACLWQQQMAVKSGSLSGVNSTAALRLPCRRGRSGSGGSTGRPN